MIIFDDKERSRFLRFALVGAIGAVVDFGIFNLLISSLPIKAVYASAVSFVAAVISNFLWNRYWTYPDSRSKPISQQLVQFAAVSVIGLGIRAILFILLEIPLINFSARYFHVLPLEASTIGHNITLAIAILIVMAWNFLVNRYWTYSDVD